MVQRRFSKREPTNVVRERESKRARAVVFFIRDTRTDIYIYIPSFCARVRVREVHRDFTVKSV